MDLNIKNKDKKMVKPFRFLPLLLTWALATGAGSLSAHSHPAPGHFAVAADFLYLLPSVDDTYFVINGAVDTTTDFTDGPRIGNDFDFSPGFRVGGFYRFCCNPNQGAEIYYSRLRSTTSKTVTGPVLSVTIPSYNRSPTSFVTFLGSASSSLDVLYQRADALFTQDVFCCRGFGFRAIAGVELAYMRLKEDFFAIAPGTTPLTLTIDNKSRTWGVGPEFGFGFDYNFCQVTWCRCPATLALTGCATGSILACKTKESQFSAESTNTTPTDINDAYTWRLVSAWHARCGLNYETNICRYGVSVEVGYEFDLYYRALSRLAPLAGNFHAYTIIDYLSFSAQGLYVSTAITF